ncbi:hypothetical protein BVC80_1225g1 [Macleaya cordata]|uniref:Uncharacterized protein n=1 Tax=Macleaya cordata TaxID=56857 RepID=A0A200R8F4_MACCD|nr:hypothetical protein BVC80_1225g1 [Macleaya cordata]
MSLNHEDDIVWSLGIDRRLYDHEIRELYELLHIINLVELNQDEDSQCWKWESNSLFSMQSCYKAYNNQSRISFPEEVIWDNRIPSKILWLEGVQWWKTDAICVVKAMNQSTTYYYTAR